MVITAVQSTDSYRSTDHGKSMIMYRILGILEDSGYMGLHM